MSAGPAIASALFQILQPELSPPDQKYGWTLDQAVERISTDAYSRYKIGDWREAAAFLAIQWISAERRCRRGPEGASLLIAQIGTLIENWQEEAYRAPSEPEPEPEPTRPDRLDLFGGAA